MCALPDEQVDGKFFLWHVRTHARTLVCLCVNMRGSAERIIRAPCRARHTLMRGQSGARAAALGLVGRKPTQHNITYTQINIHRRYTSPRPRHARASMGGWAEHACRQTQTHTHALRCTNMYRVDHSFEPFYLCMYLLDCKDGQQKTCSPYSIIILIGNQSVFKY